MKVDIMLKDGKAMGVSVQSEAFEFVFDQVDIVTIEDRPHLAVLAPIKNFRIVKEEETDDGLLTHMEVEV